MEYDTDVPAEQMRSKILTCKTQPHIDSPSLTKVTWYRDDVRLEVKRGSKYLMLDVAGLRLDITNLDKNDTGLYMCVVESDSKPEQDNIGYILRVKCT